MRGSGCSYHFCKFWFHEDDDDDDSVAMALMMMKKKTYTECSPSRYFHILAKLNYEATDEYTFYVLEGERLKLLLAFCGCGESESLALKSVLHNDGCVLACVGDRQAYIGAGDTPESPEAPPSLFPGGEGVSGGPPRKAAGVAVAGRRSKICVGKKILKWQST